MEQPIPNIQHGGVGVGVGGGKNLPLGPTGICNNSSGGGSGSGGVLSSDGLTGNKTGNNNNNCSPEQQQQQQQLPPANVTSAGSTISQQVQGRIRHDSSRASFGCVPGSPAMRPKSPHPANSYANNKSPWNSTNSNYSPASPFPPSPAHSFNPSCPPSPFSPRDRPANTYLGNTPMRAVGDLAHNSIVDMKDGCFKAPPTPSSMGSSPATPAPATPEASSLQNNSPPGEVPNSPVTLPGKSPPRGSEFVNSPNSITQMQTNAKSNPILNELLSDTKHAASRQVGSPGGGLIQSPNPTQQHQIQQQMLFNQQQQQQVQMDVDSSRDLNVATPAPHPQNIHMQQQQSQQRYVGIPPQQQQQQQPNNSQAAFQQQQQQQLARQQQQQQFHQQQLYMKQQQQNMNQQRLVQQRMNNNGQQQQGHWMTNNNPMQQTMQQQQQRQIYQQQQQQQQPQMYGQPQQQQYSMPPQGQPGAPPPPSYFDSIGWNGGQQQQPQQPPPSPQPPRQFDMSNPPQYNANGNGASGRVLNGDNFQSAPRTQHQQFNSIQTASFNGGGWYQGPPQPQQSFSGPTQQQQNSMSMQIGNDGFAVPQINGRIPVRAQQQNGGSALPHSMPNNTNNNNGGPPMSPQQPQSPFLRPLPPSGAHFVKPHPPATSPYHRSSKSIASDSLTMSEDVFRVLLAEGSLQCDKSEFDQYFVRHNPDPHEFRNQVRENHEQFKDIVEILGPNVLESKHMLSSALLNDVPMNIDECSSPMIIPPSPMDITGCSDSGPQMRLDDYSIPHSKWVEACKRKNIVKSAEILFRCLFSDEEIINCTIKGKGDTRVLDPCKKVAIIRAISWIDSNCQDGMNVDPLSYNCLAALECTLTPENKKNVEKKIFTCYRNQLKIKLTKAKGKVQDGSKEVVLIKEKLKRQYPFPPDSPIDC